MRTIVLWISSKKWIILISLLTVFLLGFAIPENYKIPVKGATTADWNHQTFWYEPWGKSGVHKGIDIFAPRGTALLASTDGVVIYNGKWGMGGKVVVVLGAKWRLHYYAHLNAAAVYAGQFVASGDSLGEVGNSGNAASRPSHLHYSIVTLFPYFWRMDATTQGWKKFYYLDPGKILLEHQTTVTSTIGHVE